MNRALAGLALTAAAIALIASRSPTAAVLAAFAGATSVPLGAFMLRLIVKLTGGERQDGVVTALQPALRTIPFTWVMVVALVVSALLAPFSARVENLYFSTPVMLARLATLYGVWTWLAWRVRRDFTPTFAAFALVFHAAALCLLSFDWSCWLGAQGAPQNLAMTIAAWHFLAGSALALMVAPLDQRLRHAYAGALAGGLIAGIYFAFIAYFTAWYGDVPERTIWFRERLAGAGGWLPAIAMLFALAALFFLAARRRLIGAGLALAALAIEAAWQFNPTPTAGSTAIALLAALAFTGLAFNTPRAPA